jgi:hypothetical protein
MLEILAYLYLNKFKKYIIILLNKNFINFYIKENTNTNKNKAIVLKI